VIFYQPVKDNNGRTYIPDGRGGWVPKDDLSAVPMTWEALTQNVPDGELHVDHEAAKEQADE